MQRLATIYHPTRRSCADWLVAAMLCVCISLSHAQTPGDSEPGTDPGVHPGDDFFAYANGDWLKQTQIPAGSARWTARSEINALTRQHVAALVENAATAPANSTARKVGDYRAAYMNEAAMEARGTAALKILWDQIDAIGDKAALTRLLGSEMRADVDPLNLGIFDSAHLLGISVAPGSRGEKNNDVFILQGGLGLPDREHYINASPDMQLLRVRYVTYIEHMLALAGLDNAAERARAVMALETAIAHSHATRESSADERNAGNLWTPEDLSREAPGLDWSLMLSAAGLTKQGSFVVWQPDAIKGAARLVASTPVETWQDYLRFRSLDVHADVLPRAFAEESRLLHATGDLPQTRADRAMTATQQQFGDAIGHLYVAQHFAPGHKARADRIVNNVIAAFTRRLKHIRWLSADSKKMAAAKLRNLYFGVAYPEKWADYSALLIDPSDALGNQRRLAEWNYRNALGRVGQPADSAMWWITPQSASAVLTFHQNAYNFSAALLQPPKFDPAASDAANYGAIGAIVGHEVSHFVDTLGADYDERGRKIHWWSSDDHAAYLQATAPLVAQVSRYQPTPTLSVNGQLTLVENLADLAGLAAAFDAHRNALGKRIGDKAYVRQQDRQFFIAFARSWRGKIRDEALATVLATDTHPPENFRIATVRNMDAWYEAFDVRPGHKLYLKPSERLRIW
jgi:putative endopeptidase